MKRNRKNNLSGWLSVLVLLLATACSENDALSFGEEGEGKNIVTFTIQPQEQSAATRVPEDTDEDMNGTDNSGDATTDDTSTLSNIGEGSKVDVLIFAVYEVKENSDGTTTTLLCPEFGKGSQVEGFNVGTGQNAIPVKKFPVNIQLATDRNKNYKVAFWAQSSKTMAFDTENLEKVEVKYDHATNNDELRDAFCKELKFSGSEKSVKVILRRPLAQVNVGAPGWDYEYMAYAKPGRLLYTRSTITLDGVAKYYNVLDGRTLSQSDLEDEETETTTATFSFSRIPAMFNVEERTEKIDDLYKSFTNEQFLKVKLYEEPEDFLPYIGWEEYKKNLNKPDQEQEDTEQQEGDAEPNVADASNTKDSETDEEPKTETFKYLSMCYVIVPEAKTISSDDTAPNATYGAVLPSVSFNFQGVNLEEVTEDKKDENGKFTINGGDSETDGPFTIDIKVENVPVQKNWRTNILGKFFTVTEKFKVYVVPDYFGDHNNIYPEDTWKDPENPGFRDPGKDYGGGSNGDADTTTDDPQS